MENRSLSDIPEEPREGRNSFLASETFERNRRIDDVYAAFFFYLDGYHMRAVLGARSTFVHVDPHSTATSWEQRFHDNVQIKPLSVPLYSVSLHYLISNGSLTHHFWYFDDTNICEDFFFYYLICNFSPTQFYVSPARQVEFSLGLEQSEL